MKTTYLLVLVPFLVEHGEWYDEKDKDRFDDVDGEPEVLHGFLKKEWSSL